MKLICRSTNTLPWWLALAAFAFICNPSTAHAMRVVAFLIKLDGELVLFGRHMDRGEGRDEVWGYLNSVKFKRPASPRFGAKGGYGEGFEVVPDKDNPLTATLTGNITIDCRYGGNVKLKSLKLIRANADAQEWQLAPEEVARTFKLRGQEPSEPVTKKE